MLRGQLSPGNVNCAIAFVTKYTQIGQQILAAFHS